MSICCENAYIHWIISSNESNYRIVKIPTVLKCKIETIRRIVRKLRNVHVLPRILERNTVIRTAVTLHHASGYCGLHRVFGTVSWIVLQFTNLKNGNYNRSRPIIEHILYLIFTSSTPHLSFIIGDIANWLVLLCCGFL